MHFVSVDLKSANYQALHLHGLIEESWNDFLSQFTSNPYYLKSKVLRMKCLSTDYLFRRKQQLVCRNLIVSVLNSLSDHEVVTNEMVCALNVDELILIADDVSVFQSYLASNFPKLQFRAEGFRLKKVGKCYVKVYDNGQVEFKCVSASTLPAAVKMYNV